MKQKLLNSIRLRIAMLVALLCSLGTGSVWADTYEQLTSIANIDESAEYVLGIDGTGFHYDGTSSWGKTALPSAQTPFKYTLKKAQDGNSFTAETTISGTKYYLQIPTSNSFSMATSTGTNTDIIIGTTQVSGTNYAVANKTTTTRHLRINGSSGLRSYAGTTGTMAFFYKVVPPAPSYEITAVSNNDSYGTVSLESSTITGSPKSGYRYATPAYTVSSGSATVSQSGDAFTVTPSSDCTVTINFEAIPTHTATFSVNGETTSDPYQEGADIDFPDNPDDINGKTFVGWVSSAIVGTTDIEPSFVTSAKMSTNDVTYYAVFATEGESSTTKTDNMTLTDTGVSGNSYSSWSGVTLTSSAVYSGCNAGGNDAIQLNATSGTSYRGIISTTSGGTLSKVTITWNSNTATDRSITVYGSNSAYTTMSAFNSSKGTELGSITKGTSTELTITGSYKYVGFYATSAIYIDNIAIDWDVTETTYSAYCTTVSLLPVPTITFKDGEENTITVLNANSLNAFIPVSVTCSAGDVTLSLESSNDEVADYDEGNVLTYAEGTATITATFAGNGSYQGTSATLTVNVERGTTTLSFPATPSTINIGATATYTATGSPAVSGITYSSDNPSAVTVNSTTGEIEAVAKGNATITASFDGNDDYKAAETSYTIRVVNPNEITYTLTNSQIVSGGPDAVSGYGTKAISDANDKTWNAYAIKNQHSNQTSGYHFLQIRAYDNTTAYYIQVPAYGTRITELQMTVSSSSAPMGNGGNTATLFFSASNTTSATGDGVASGTGESTVTIDCSALNLNTGYITASGAVRIWDVKVTYEYALPVGSALWTSHVTADAVDFTGVTAYIAKKVNSETVTIDQVTSAPANTPVIIKADAAKTYYLQTKYSSLADVSANILEASDGSVTGDGVDSDDDGIGEGTIYALGKKNGEVGFYLVKSGVSVPAGKAYLTIGGGSVKEFLGFSFGDETKITETSESIHNSECIMLNEAGAVFDLSGRRVSKAQKGLYILNGHKVLVK